MTRACKPIAGDHMPCGVPLDDHGSLVDGGFVHPPYPCVADHRVTHDEDELEACRECMPTPHRPTKEIA